MTVKKAIAIEPDDAKAYVGMGWVYQKQGQYPNAIAAYKNAIVLEPTGIVADTANKRIHELSRK